jgi:hypothetical protein
VVGFSFSLSQTGGDLPETKLLSSCQPILYVTCISAWIQGEKWDGVGTALSVAVSGPGENLRQNLGLTDAPCDHVGLSSVWQL